MRSAEASALARPQVAGAVATALPSSGERLVKKGRHRRFEEARSLKRAVEVVAEPCPECGADPEDDHASWCLYEESELDEDEDEDEPPLGGLSRSSGPESNGPESNGVGAH